MPRRSKKKRSHRAKPEGKAQVATEQLILLGIILAVVIPLSYVGINLGGGGGDAKLVQMEETMLNTAESLSALGAGNAQSFLAQTQGILNAQFSDCTINDQGENECRTIELNLADGNNHSMELDRPFYGDSSSLAWMTIPGTHLVTLHNTGNYLIFQVCGDNKASGTEQCDGSDDASCGGEACIAPGNANQCMCSCDPALPNTCPTGICVQTGPGTGYCGPCRNDADCSANEFCSLGVCQQCDADNDLDNNAVRCPGPPTPPNTNQDCNDNDQNVNSRMNEGCSDPTCAGGPVCAGSPPTPLGCFLGQASCADGLDNDCDGLSDCSDPSCSGVAGCVAGPPPPSCGNSACDPTEDCNTCPADCPCNAGDVCNSGVTPAICAPSNTCPNGVVDAGEECDDGNLLNTDQCSDTCTLTYCQDGIRQAVNGYAGSPIWNGGNYTGVEECDDGNFVHFDGCDNWCRITPTLVPSCGNLIIEPGEDCDGVNFGGLSCLNYGSQHGMLACNPPGSPNECTIDTSGCFLAECSDNGDNDTDTLVDYGPFASNEPIVDCTSPADDDESGANNFCGDGSVDAGEECDPGSVALGVPAGLPACPTVGGVFGYQQRCTNTCQCVTDDGLHLPPWPGILLSPQSFCGDGNVDSPNSQGVIEQCDPPGTTHVVNIPCPAGSSEPHTQITFTCDRACQWNIVLGPGCGSVCPGFGGAGWECTNDGDCSGGCGPGAPPEAYDCCLPAPGAAGGCCGCCVGPPGPPGPRPNVGAGGTTISTTPLNCGWHEIGTAPGATPTNFYCGGTCPPQETCEKRNGICGCYAAGITPGPGPTGGPEVCNNLIDDNGDGRIDCADPLCSADPHCVRVPTGPLPPPGVEICNNFVDDDRDGMMDCEDTADCCSSASCSGTPYCTTTPPVTNEICNNLVDDDGDGAIDCDDNDCLGTTDCAPDPTTGPLPPPPPVVEICNNGVDDDGNGRTDCADPACVNDDNCTRSTNVLSGVLGWFRQLFTGEP